MPSPGCHWLPLSSADLKIHPREPPGVSGAAVLVGGGETSDKTCRNALMQRDPCAVSEVALVTALCGDRAAESPWVSPAPLARVRDGFFQPSQCRQALKGPCLTLHEEKVVPWAGYLAEVAHFAQAQLSNPA